MVSRAYIFTAFKYWCRIFFKYRSEVFFSFVSELAIPILINILFLVGVCGTDFDYTQIRELIEYVIIANIIYTISMTNIEETIAWDIKSARLVYKLQAPISSCLDYIIADVAAKVIRCMLFYFPVMIILIGTGGILVLDLLKACMWLMFAIVIGYCISFLISCFAFWVTEIWGVSAIKNLLFSVFAGAIFPFYILPQHVRKVMMMMPFPYVSYVPTAILLGNIEADEIWFLVIGGGVWCVILSLAAVLVWKKGIKKYESAGM